MGAEITIKTPGKLMVAGEFAVLEPYHQLIVTAVDRFLYTNIRDSEVYEVNIKNYKLFHQRFHFDGENVRFEKEGKAIRFVKGTLTTTLKYLREKGIEITPFTLTIQSELDDTKTGQKYGLGSSAAVVTSVVTAVLTKFLDEQPSKKIIFKLAAIAHTKTQGSGSGADIAASTYGGVLKYASFQAEWLLEKLETVKSISQFVESEWPYLTIQRLQFPSSLQFCVGWTGKPASTKSLVSEIKKIKKDDHIHYEKFLENSKRAVQLIVTGMEKNDIETFYLGIEENRKALSEIGKIANVEIETKKLNILSKEAKLLGGVGKLSGAGGGDCGIAFVPSHDAAVQLHNRWLEKGIKPLNISIYLKGSERI